MANEFMITGSEGFVGGHLTKELKRRGHETVGTTLKVPESGLPEGVVQCDILDQEALNKLVHDLRPKGIFHLAAQANVGSSFSQPQRTIEINVQGTVNLLDAVRSVGKGYRPRIILIGSSGIFGIPENGPLTEDSPIKPINPYAESKAAALAIGAEYAKKYGMDIIFAIPFNHTGPGQGRGFLPPDIASQIVDIENGLKDPVIFTGDLSTERDYSDVRDVVGAYRLLMELGRSGEKYIISSGKPVSVRKIVEDLVNMSSIPVKLLVDKSLIRPVDLPRQYGSHEKITRETGWNPEIPLEKTLKDLLDWYRGKGKINK